MEIYRLIPALSVVTVRAYEVQDTLYAILNSYTPLYRSLWTPATLGALQSRNRP